MALSDSVPSSAIDVFKRNAEDTDKVVNQASGSVTTRTGKEIKSFKQLEGEFDSARQLAVLNAEGAVESAITGGLYVPVGNFGTEFTITERREVGYDGSVYWRWNGALPHTVLATDTPSSPAWTDVTQATLAADLVNPAESGNRVARMAITADSLVDFLDAPFIDGRTYSNNGFYPGATVGGGQWKAVSGADLTQNNGGTFVSKAALQAWYDAAVAAGGVTTANLHANLSTLFAAGTGTGDGFVRVNANRYYSCFEFGATGDYVYDDTAALRQALKSKVPIKLKENVTHKVSMPASEDPGDECILQLDASKSSIFIGSGYSSMIKLDAQNSIDSGFSIVGLNRRDPTPATFLLGNFRVDGDSSNKKANQEATGVGLQAGTSVTADYEIDLATVWVQNTSFSGVILGTKRIHFEKIATTNTGFHGVDFRNVSGDGRLMRITGGAISTENAAQLAVNFSGGSSVGGGPLNISVDKIYGENTSSGVKIAGNHQGEVGLISLKNIGQTDTNPQSAFYSNFDFKKFKINKLVTENCRNGSISHAHAGEIIVGSLVSIENNSSVNPNGDVITNNANGRLIINNYAAKGRYSILAGAYLAINAFECEYFKCHITELYDFSPDVNYSAVSVRSNGYSEVSGLIQQDNNAGVTLIRMQAETDGVINFKDLSFSGSQLGDGINMAGSANGKYMLSNTDVSGFAEGGVRGDYRRGVFSNVTGFTLTATTNQLLSAADSINQSGKTEGRMVFNPVTNRPVYASSPVATDPWFYADGTLAHNPS